MSAHFDGVWYPRSCDMCGCPCAPMKVGNEYLCDICREFNEQPTCDYCKEPGPLEHVTWDHYDHETGPQHDEADMCAACVMQMVRRRA